MVHLTKLQSDFGKKGLTVIGINQDESRAETLRYMLHQDAGFGYAVGIGSSKGYANDGVPDGALIGPDGKVAWMGHPATLADNTVGNLLKKVHPLKPEEQEARAAAALASAEGFIADRHLARAERILQKTIDRWGATASGKRAAARIRDIADGDFKAEYDAQREIAKLVGGVEKPAQKLDPAAADKLAKALDARADAWKESAPAAAAIAREWARITATAWK